MEIDFLLSLLLPRANVLLLETIIKSKVKPFFKTKYFLEKYFSTRRKKNCQGSPKNGEEKWFPIAAKSVVPQPK